MPEYLEQVMLASVQTLVRRLDDVYEWPDLIAVNECHHATSPTYARILNAAYDAVPGNKPWVIGLTATPSRLDGRGLGEQFDAIAPGPAVAELTEQGFLAPYRIVAPAKAVKPQVAKRAGDYAVGALEEWLTAKKIIGDAIDTYKKYVGGKTCLVYCVSRKYARAVAEEYVAAGVDARYVAGDTPTEERRESIQLFREGRLQVIVSVDLFGEGLDCPNLSAVQLLRPTMSLGLHLQQVGRVLRPGKGKDVAYILDHVGNSWRHGLPDDDRSWTLEGKQKATRVQTEEEIDIALSHCKECHSIFKTAPFCPNCGAPVEAKRKPPEQEDGKMIELNRAQLNKLKKELQQSVARRRLQEDREASSLEELVRLAIERGYKVGWAARKWAYKKGHPYNHMSPFRRAHFYKQEKKVRKALKQNSRLGKDSIGAKVERHRPKSHALRKASGAFWLGGRRRFGPHI